MIRGEELMKGNYVQANKYAYNEKEGEVLIVDGICSDVSFTNGTTQNYADIDPIPLTEEWLLKFGFEYSKEEVCYFKQGTSIEDRNTDNFLPKEKKASLEGCFGYWHFSGYIKEIKYVHELQNVHFINKQEKL